jgi:hypothetical protein
MMKDSSGHYVGHDLWGRRRGLVVVRRWQPVKPLPLPPLKAPRRGEVGRGQPSAERIANPGHLPARASDWIYVGEYPTQ